MRFTSRGIAALATALLLSALAPLSGASADTTIVIVRHGEKPAGGYGQLTCRGLNRALALGPRLSARYGMPAAVHAPDPAAKKDDGGRLYAYVRPLMTVEPLAIRAGLPVDIDFDMTEIAALGERLIAGSGTQVVAWEHHWAETLARYLVARLGGDASQVPGWADDDYDSIFVIRAGGGEVTFTREHEGLDGLADDCPDGPHRTP